MSVTVSPGSTYDPAALRFSGERALALETKFVEQFPYRHSGQPGQLHQINFAKLQAKICLEEANRNGSLLPVTALIDHLGKALLISTPRGRNWFYDEWLKGQPGGNPLYAEQFARLMTSLDRIPQVILATVHGTDPWVRDNNDLIRKFYMGM